MSSIRPLRDAAAITLAAGDLKATFLPSYGMLGASLRHKGEEILGRVEDLESAALKGSAAGIPLLHPWANRLAGYSYRASGQDVSLDPSSPMLHFDENGLPIHGVPWPLLQWEVIEATQDRVTARLEWSRQDLLTVFPFRHRIELTASLALDALTLETTLFADGGGPVPVSFGFHPYLRLPGLSRAEWQLHAPPMRRIVLDWKGIPAGEEMPFAGLDAELRELDLDDGFALLDERAVLSLTGADRRIAVEWVEGYRYAQIYAPENKAYIALEPMTAPTNALRSGTGLQLVEAGGTFRAAFQIRIEAFGPERK
ncbi:MAG: aldose 1-epimerase [Rhodomicrobium sp.]